MDSELDFEMELIHHLESIGGTKQWEYLPNIKTIAALWANFRSILERNNKEKLQGTPLSDAEFAQVKKVICDLGSPYEAGRWIYGMNGVTQVEVDRDDKSDGSKGDHIFLTVFDQSNVGAGNTVYQIVNQIEHPRVLAGRKQRRFDTTLLINGLPVIHIEEKFHHHDAHEALNQIRQYIDEGQFSDIYSTVQILVGMTPDQALYMANTDSESFNTDFAFQWQREADSKPVWGWREFADLMLSIPMAHQMATSYMILDGDPKHKNLIVMRPYQVYATKRVINALRKYTFGVDKHEVGYIWHTTGSGKTISSFKTAWLASRLPNVDKVVFVVDRVALTDQTFAKYNAYDPDTDDENNNGVVSETANTGVLAQKLRSKQANNTIVVTSIQKLDRLCKRDSFAVPDKNFVFIVDEAHRSTNGDMLKRIKKSFLRSAWVGYTGTPVFDGDLTRQAFGDVLHTYTIREAIADGNVLGFKVDFEHTLKEAEIKDELLPKMLEEKYPNWGEKAINKKIANMSPEEVDDYIDSDLYDNNAKHVEAVVDDIVKHWRNRSKEGKYSAILTTHVGGLQASAPMALQYFDEFQKKNEELIAAHKKPLNVAVTFSYATDNSEHQLEKNKGLRRAMDAYNATFGTSFDDETVDGYFKDVMGRLRGEDDGPKLDLVIVIDQLLTGYDAPKVNTLYVDRTLAGANLIQAYSRTNRIDNHKDKPWGIIVNYRWPETSKRLMDAALKVYANRESASVQGELEDPGLSGVVAEEFKDTLAAAKEVVNQIRELSDGFTEVPPSENAKQELANLISKYGTKVSQLKQYTEYDYDRPEKLCHELGITEDNDNWINNSARNVLKDWAAKHPKDDTLDLSMLDFDVEHIAEVKINYDYIAELLAQVLNEVHEGKDAQETYGTFVRATDQLEDRRLAGQMKDTADAAMNGEDLNVEYPVQPNSVEELVRKRTKDNRQNAIADFRHHWGLVEVMTADLLIDKMLQRHTLDADDLRDGEELSKLLGMATKGRVYKQAAEDPAVRELSPVKYRNEFRAAFREFADYVVAHY
ncbi:HsdR family type I site-specific deoxyribonuclease [Bifidobacterium sp. ESL0775]|uniref:type I restriction endonuclease subunit R n=1 Tax=Bifidobacterium sp. ESL0775 TaxID=2983230 RepID=UPI0023F638F7|nr:HsdR family type I site-specific deoxyribonuclease [Bifidobacterium sp. ESL0775]WEV68917.1 HsdR family type I site-specific deoxyribonuclease [Bifidobacterium sp. ESL0775]